MTVAELLAKYPYDPTKVPQDFPVGSPERLRGVPPEFREGLASIYLRCEPRWLREEMGRRTEELRRQHRPMQPQSREHVDHWNEGAER